MNNCINFNGLKVKFECGAKTKDGKSLLKQVGMIVQNSEGITVTDKKLSRCYKPITEQCRWGKDTLEIKGDSIKDEVALYNELSKLKPKLERDDHLQMEFDEDSIGKILNSIV